MFFIFFSLFYKYSIRNNIFFLKISHINLLVFILAEELYQVKISSFFIKIKYK